MFYNSRKNTIIFNLRLWQGQGSIIDFVMSYMNVTELEALQILAGKIGYQLQSTPNSTPKHKSNNIHEVIAKYYHQVFLKDAEKQKYQLQVRGHTPETLEKRMIGVTDRRLHIYLENEGFSEFFQKTCW